MVGKRIAFLRIGKGWSQAELAKRIGSTARTIYLFERGKQQPSPECLAGLAEEFGVTTEYLLTGKTQQNDPYTDSEVPHISIRVEALIDYLRSASE